MNVPKACIRLIESDSVGIGARHLRFAEDSNVQLGVKTIALVQFLKLEYAVASLGELVKTQISGTYPLSI